MTFNDAPQPAVPEPASQPAGAYAAGQQPIDAQSFTPIENVQRGTVFALAIIPLGIIAWVLIWSIGFIASIVGFGVAAGAVALYRLGSGGPVSRGAAVRVTLITVVTLLLAFVAGLVADVVVEFSRINQTDWFSSLVNPDFWTVFSKFIASPLIIPQYAPSFAIALGLGLLGCFSVLRGTFRAAAAPAAPASWTAPGQTLTQDAAPASYTAPGYSAPAVPAAPEAPAAPADGSTPPADVPPTQPRA